MGTRTGKNGDAPSSYSDEALRHEIWRVRTKLGPLTPKNAGIRKSLQSRLHNLERDLARRG